MESINKIYAPTVIDENPFPQDSAGNYNTTQQAKSGTYGAVEVKDQSLPVKKVATELLSDMLNTRSKKILQEVQFTPSGALQIGQYEPGVSGDIRVSPNGIVARNIAGQNTFVLDGDTGDAFFAGQLQAGSLITGRVQITQGNIVIVNNNVVQIFIGVT